MKKIFYWERNMKMIKKIPSENMKKMYLEKRQNTLRKIQDAIDEIQEDNRIVTKKELMSITGISSGTFSQDYVKELLKKNKVCQFRVTTTISTSQNKKKLEEETILALTKENQKLISKMQDFEIVLEQNNNKYNKLKDEYSKLESDYRLLKGKYQQLLEYLDALGANLDNLPLI